MAPELDSSALEEQVDSQAVKARFNPWWVLGAMLFILAVVLGFRTLRKAKSKKSDSLVIEDIVIESGGGEIPHP